MAKVVSPNVNIYFLMHVCPGIGARKFRSKVHDCGDRSVWTDTPSDKLRKQEGTRDVRVNSVEEVRVVEEVSVVNEVIVVEEVRGGGSER